MYDLYRNISILMSWITNHNYLTTVVSNCLVRGWLCDILRSSNGRSTPQFGIDMNLRKTKRRLRIMRIPEPSLGASPDTLSAQKPQKDRQNAKEKRFGSQFSSQLWVYTYAHRVEGIGVLPRAPLSQEQPIYKSSR